MSDKETIARFKADVTRAEAERDRAEADWTKTQATLDQVWGEARLWHSHAHHMRNIAAGLQRTVVDMAGRLQEPPPPAPVLTLPTFGNDPSV